jgi:hypothetical protein
VSEYVLLILNAALFGMMQFTAVLLALVVLFLCLARFRLRRALNYATPVVVALEAQINRYSRVFTLCLVLLTVMMFINHKHISDYAIGRPLLGSREAIWGMGIFGFWFMLFLSDSLRYGGFPPALPPTFRTDVSTKFHLMAFSMGLALIFWANTVTAPIFWMIVGGSGALYGAYVLHLSYGLANRAYSNALLATAEESECDQDRESLGDLRFVHVTDLHITKKGESRNESEPPGNMRLESLGRELPNLPLAWLFATGDLVDHGREEEWQEACALLKAIQNERPGLRILVAPGNHDLATAYNTLDAVFALSVARRRRSQPQSSGIYLQRYLRFASELEPQLKTHAGDVLEKVLASKATVGQEIVDRWMEIAEAGVPSLVQCERLADQAAKAYPETSKDGWAAAFARKPLRPIPAYFKETLEPMLWRSEWFAHFPLQLRDDDAREAVVILNSNAPDPTLYGSAWGELGAEQLTRLTALLDTLNEFTVYLLCHHAPFRWSTGKPPTTPSAIKDWATSSVLTDDIAKLRDAIVAFRTRGARNELIFLCGHRHGGEGSQTLIGQWDGGQVIEGASFADPRTRLASGWKGQQITLRVLSTPFLPVSSQPRAN